MPNIQPALIEINKCQKVYNCKFCKVLRNNRLIPTSKQNIYRLKNNSSQVYFFLDKLRGAGSGDARKGQESPKSPWTLGSSDIDDS